MNSRDIKTLVDEMDKSVRSDDPRMRRCVMIIHEDGSSMFFRNAYMQRHGNWLLVFTEHQGSHYFCINDLSDYMQLERLDEKPELVDSYGEPVVFLQCSYCKNEIVAADIQSVYDENGNRIDADVCEGCQELHIGQEDVFPIDECLRSDLLL
jgi:hypothetical protein